MSKFNETIAFLRKNLALVALILAFLASAITVYFNQAEVFGGDIKVIRLGHWQLEPGVREAFSVMGEDYQRLHPNVRVRQDAIPDRMYGQWLTTQLLGRSAPDILQVMNYQIPYNIWLSYYIRFFEVMTPHVMKPNPYNKGTEFEGVPLLDTTKDGLRFCYQKEMQEFMAIGLAQFGTRIFYNKTLLEELTGDGEPITNYREFLRACEIIRSQTNEETGKPYIAIAGSKYHFPAWEQNLIDPITFTALEKVDFDRSADAGVDEIFAAFKSGIINMSFPAYRARFRMVREITSQFQEGFTGLRRDEAVFPFMQGKAVFLAVGTHDAGMLREQSKGQFELGIMNFPFPSKNDPEYGDLVKGPRFELQFTFFQFGVTSDSPNKDIAIDFLKFIASKKQNEKFNSINNWIPCIKNTKMSDFLSVFQPNSRGVYKAYEFNLGGNTWVRYLQEYSSFQINQLTFEEFTNNFIPFYLDKGADDYKERMKDWQRTKEGRARFALGLKAKAMNMTNEAELESTWIKYRSAVIEQQLLRDMKMVRQEQIITEGVQAQEVGPYEYTPLAKQNIIEKYDISKAELEEILKKFN